MKLTVKKVEPGFILTVLFVLLIAAELYFAYFLLLKNLTVADEGPDVKNIVRVDSKSYRDTLDYLTGLEGYQAGDDAFRNLFLKKPLNAAPPAASSPTSPATAQSSPKTQSAPVVPSR